MDRKNQNNRRRRTALQTRRLEILYGIDRQEEGYGQNSGGEAVDGVLDAVGDVI